jgi:hypothetical protein
MRAWVLINFSIYPLINVLLPALLSRQVIYFAFIAPIVTWGPDFQLQTLFVSSLPTCTQMGGQGTNPLTGICFLSKQNAPTCFIEGWRVLNLAKIPPSANLILINLVYQSTGQDRVIFM